MAQGYGEGFFYTPEDQAAQEAVRMRQAYAAALLKGGRREGQYAGLADAGDKIAGALMGRSANKEYEKLATDSQARRAADYAYVLKGGPGSVSNSAGTPQEMDPEGNPMAPAQSQQPTSTMAQRLTERPGMMFQFGDDVIRQQMQQDAKRVTPMADAEAQALGLRGKWGREATGNPVLIQASDVKSKEALEQEIDADHRKGLLTPEEERQRVRIAAAGRAPTPDFGRGMTGQAYNILSQGIKDPSVRGTPQYMTAWQILSNPKIDPNTGTMVIPDLSAFAPPTGMQGGAPQPGPAPAPGQPQPGAGGLPQRMPSVQSFAPPNPSDTESKAAGFAKRLAASDALLGQFEGALIDPDQRAKSHVPIFGNKFVSNEFQQGSQAERDFINAQLRRESGAVINDEEFVNARKQYIPQPWDGKEVLLQKKAARALARQNMEMSAGNSMLPPGVIQQSSPPRNAPMVPQNQGFGIPDNGQTRVRTYNAQTGKIE